MLADIAAEPLDDRLVVLRGPRRVGKSVVLKDVIRALCARPDLDARQIVYLAADELSALDLHRAIVLGRDLTRSVDQPSPRQRVWLIGEVTGRDGWTTALKFLRDNTAFGLDTVVCTGSSWADSADVARDLLAGRAGIASTHRSRLLLPMSFRDFVDVTRPDLPRFEPAPLWALQTSTVADVATVAQVATDAFDLAWQTYLTCGGYPRAVAEHHRAGRVSRAFLADLEAWIHRDIDPHAPGESIPRLLVTLHRRSTAPLNRSRVASELGYGSRQSFDLRLAKLTRTFGGIWCHQVSVDGRRVAGAQAKLYLGDPILAWLGADMRAGLEPPDMTVLTEGTLAAGLAATVEALQPGRWPAEDVVGYLRTGTNAEVDFAAMPLPSAGGDARSTPIESKWFNHGWRPETRALMSQYGAGIVATKSVTDTSGPVWAIPAPLLALLIS